ncbi:MAG: fasciclin domain-containing protein [Sphingobacteriales bacterium]
MKKLTCIILIFLNVSFAFAQKTDTVKSNYIKTADPTVAMRNIDGIMMYSGNNLIENISLSPQFTILVNLIKAAGLTDSFKTGIVTFFAPTNGAFAKLAPGILDTLLLPAHKTDLINLLNHHAVSGNITSRDIERQIKAGNGQATFTSLSGELLIAQINENRNIVLTDENGEQTVITRLNIRQDNGMLFIVNTVLLPKAKQ